MQLNRTNTKHISTVSHEGKVLIVASVVEQPDQVHLYYTVKQDGFEKSAIQKTDGILWENFEKLGLPNDDEYASVLADEQQELTDKQGNFILRSIYKSADLTAAAPVQLVSHNGFVYLFRQSTAATLLVDRFVLDGMTNKLGRKLEVRFKRSKQRYTPKEAPKITSGGQMQPGDSLDFKDINNQPFYEPTTELCPKILDGLKDGWFGVVVCPTSGQESYRWHIFAYHYSRQSVELVSLTPGTCTCSMCRMSRSAPWTRILVR